MMSDRLQKACEIAVEAGKLAQSMRQNPDRLLARIKGPLDLVTAADIAVENLVRERIRVAYPGEAVLGEESGLAGDSQRTWIVDPIDGTVNFSRGMPDWAVSIAFFDGQDISHGVIHAPDLNLTAFAERGKGCFVGEQRVVPSRHPSDCPLVALGYSLREKTPSYFNRIDRLLEAGFEHRRHGAATICFLGVAAGWFDGFFEQSLNVWDAAAGLVIVEESGGTTKHDTISEFLTGPSDVLARNSNFPELDRILF